MRAAQTTTDPRDERINGLADALREIISLADDAAMHNSRDALRLIVGVCGRALGDLGGGEGGEERVGDWLKAKTRVAELEAALTSIRDLLPIEQDNYALRVFAIAANALEPDVATNRP